MKQKGIALLLIAALIIGIVCWLGVGTYSSGSAVSDLKAELEGIYGSAYTGKPVEDGTEDLVFEIEPKTWFLTNWSLRNALGLDYRYECRVIFTTHTRENAKTVRTITYRGFDPMGKENAQARARLDLDSKTEAIEITGKKVPAAK